MTEIQHADAGEWPCLFGWCSHDGRADDLCAVDAHTDDGRADGDGASDRADGEVSGRADVPILIDFDEVQSPLKVQVMETVSFKPDASYLVTGGFGGFGQKTSRWLVDHGARHIVLAGRSGADTPERQAFVQELRQQGANVLTLACDLADASAVRLTGNVVGKAPFTGTLSHRGWRAAKVTLPQLAESHDARVLAPAEVEL